MCNNDMSDFWFKGSNIILCIPSLVASKKVPLESGRLKDVFQSQTDDQSCIFYKPSDNAPLVNHLLV